MLVGSSVPSNSATEDGSSTGGFGSDGRRRLKKTTEVAANMIAVNNTIENFCLKADGFFMIFLLITAKGAYRQLRNGRIAVSDVSEIRGAAPPKKSRSAPES